MEGLSAMEIEWILNAMDYGICYFGAEWIISVCFDSLAHKQYEECGISLRDHYAVIPSYVL